LISRQQQIQNIRKYIAEEIQNVGLKRTIITALKKNNQDVTGKLVNQILNVDYRKSSRYLQVRSKWNGNIGMVYDIKVDVLLPWGKYGAKLDTVEGRKSKAKGKMQPSTNDIYQWIIKKGLFKTGFYRQKKRLQSGTKTYVYSLNRASFQKGVAYRIARKIRKENELKTRNPYSSSLGIKLEFAVMKAFKRFADEFALDYLNDFTLNFGKAKK
jgi:hypothetical protein